MRSTINREHNSYTRQYKKVTVYCKSGDEGPSYDPYSYTEYSFTSKRFLRNGVTITLHLGLKDTLKVDGEEVARTYKEVSSKFKKVVGAKLDEFLEVVDAPPQLKCPKCKGTKFEHRSSFPGEELTICVKCKEIVDSYVNWSAIE